MCGYVVTPQDSLPMLVFLTKHRGTVENCHQCTEHKLMISVQC